MKNVTAISRVKYKTLFPVFLVFLFFPLPVNLTIGKQMSRTNQEFREDKSKTILENDGFILINDLNDFRGYASRDAVKVRMKPGVYTLDKALSKSFIEVTGNNSTFDMKGVKFMVDTRLFSLFGTGVTLMNAEITTEGSSPWGYGSLYGISGGDVRKMNWIRVGWPAKNVKLIGCKVHMRAMGHAIFVQGAENKLINCKADAKYSEALCLAYINASGAYVDLEILDSRGGRSNDLLAKINGSDHHVILNNQNPHYIPDGMAIELSTSKGYGGPRGNTSAVAKNIQLTNKTIANVILNPGAYDPVIESIGKVMDLTNLR